MTCRGSWKSTAKDIVYNGNNLKCKLKTRKGKWLKNEITFFPQYEYHNIDGRFEFHKNKCIILTSFVNKERQSMYLKRVSKWVNSGIYIYLVDSNNTGFDLISPNYNQFLFDQTKEDYYKYHKEDSTHLEIKSILKIVNHFSLTEKYDYIYKITCKYYFDNYKILDISENVSGNDLIFQKSHNKKYQNSELVGFKSDKIVNILNFILKRDIIFEEGLGIIKNQNYKFKNLNAIKLTDRVKRGDGSILNYL